MARRRDRRNGPAVPVKAVKEKAVKDKAESYEGDDEGRDEDSPPVSPAVSHSKVNDSVATESPAEPSKKNKKGKSKKDEEFEVEQIVGMEVNFRWRCPVRFRVRWVGYTEKDDTWVSVYNLNCENFVQDFLSISGRLPEYEKAMDRAQQQTVVNTEYRENLRRRDRPQYFEDSDDAEEILMTTSTRTRKTRRPDMFDAADARPQLLKTPKKLPPKVGVSRAHALAQQAGREYEVVLITDHRVKGRFTEYKVRWKGLTSAHDSWVPEANLTCPKLIADYLKSIKSEPEQEYEVAAIIDSRDVDGAVSYKVRWKGFSAKFDSWLPKEEMNCPEMISKFEDALEKLNKKEDWVVKKIRAKQKRSGKVEYLVNWEGFESKFDTWEPEENLQDCQEKLDDFFALQEKKQQKNKRSTQNGGSDQSDEEETSHKELEEEQEEEITIKSKNKRKRSASRSAVTPSPVVQSRESTRKRRITLPVAYDEENELSD